MHILKFMCIDMQAEFHPCVHGLFLVLSVLIGELIKKMERDFTRTCSDRTRRNSFKLGEGIFRLNIRNKFFS